MSHVDDSCAEAVGRALGADELEGHFPSDPIVPGVLLIEMMAQTAGVILAFKLRRRPGPAGGSLASIRRARFMVPLPAGTETAVSARVLSAMPHAIVAAAGVHVGDRVISTAELIVAGRRHG